MRQQFMRLAMDHIHAHGARYTIDLLDREAGEHNVDRMSEDQLDRAVKALVADVARLDYAASQRRELALQKEERRRHNAQIDNARAVKQEVKRQRREAAGR